MRVVDRLALLAAYLILVGAVAWMSWDTQRTLERVEEDVCAVAEITVLDTLLMLSLADITEDRRQDALDAILLAVEVGEAVQARCGLTFLDELPDVPDIDVGG